LRSGTGCRHGDMHAWELGVRGALLCVEWGRGGNVPDKGHGSEVADWAHHFGKEVVCLEEVDVCWCLILGVVCDV
jgi:hypothetical protein